MKRCKQEGIDPKSRKAPKTIEEATEQFFNIPKGDIGEVLPEKRSKMARDNIQVIATGNSKDKPDLLIWDNGEGQYPDDFKSTFLSIANNNKTDIAFVQGKYNMGSTGAVTFCGEYRYQLIASKKDQQCFDKDDNYSDNLFGWTLVRRHSLTDAEELKFGSTWYEFFAIDGKIIPQFKIDSLDIGLFYDKPFETGSFIKLYSYEMPKGTKDNISTSTGLYATLNQLLYKPALPFYLYEDREPYKTPKAILHVGVYGNYVRITDQNKVNDLLEISPIFEQISNEDIGEVTVTVYVLSKGENPQQHQNRKRRYIGTGRNVIYILNGQVQGTEGQPFITQELKYNLLKDSMLVVIDCSKVTTGFRQDLFMANRSNLRESEKSEQLRNKVIAILKDNDTLKRLNTERKDKILHGGDAAKEKELIEKLMFNVPLDKSLTKLLKKGIDLVNLPSGKQRTSKKGEEKKRPKENKRFPSIFKINIKEDKQTGKRIKSIPLNGKGSIQFETDVVDDYFYRPQEKGKFQVHILGGQDNNESDGGTEAGKPNKVEDFFEVNKSGPSDGSIKLMLKPREALNVGDEIELNARLTSC